MAARCFSIFTVRWHDLPPRMKDSWLCDFAKSLEWNRDEQCIDALTDEYGDVLQAAFHDGVPQSADAAPIRDAAALLAPDRLTWVLRSPAVAYHLFSTRDARRELRPEVLAPALAA